MFQEAILENKFQCKFEKISLDAGSCEIGENEFSNRRRNAGNCSLPQRSTAGLFGTISELLWIPRKDYFRKYEGPLKMKCPWWPSPFFSKSKSASAGKIPIEIVWQKLKVSKQGNAYRDFSPKLKGVSIGGNPGTVGDQIQSFYFRGNFCRDCYAQTQSLQCKEKFV